MAAFGDRPQFRLKPLQVPTLLEPIPIEDQALTLGRADDNSVSLAGDVFPSVSQHHARLEVNSEGELWLQDLDSRNGCLVNGERTKRSVLVRGDVLQLGTIGPRFVVLAGSPLHDTMFVDPDNAALRRVREAKLTDSMFGDIKEALGVPEDVGIQELVERRTAANLLRLVILLAVTALVAGVWWNRDKEKVETNRSAELAELQQSLEANREARRQELEKQNAAFAQELQQLQSRNTQLEADRLAQQERVDKLIADGGSSSEELAALRTQLAQTRTDLEAAQDQLRLLDPVDLEKARLVEVSRVRRAIVLLESHLFIEDTSTGERMYLSEAHMDEPNFDGQGEVFSIDSTGSGFCISADGWILTNGHVVSPHDEEPVLFGAEQREVHPVMEVFAVFSGTAERLPVEVVKVVYNDREDLALVKIAPFEGMPYLEGFDLEAPLPDAGSEVYLFGFPLGNFALQQGETVIASTFRGITSRVVDGRLQVDAGVHPGNSGGPVTDTRGRVIGVVVSVQSMPDQTSVYTIGYAIPIEAANAVWPPPASWSPLDKTE